MRKFVLLVAALALAMMVAVPLAQAHVLYLSKAQQKSVAITNYVCDGIGTCSHFHVDPCHRISAHKVRCKSHLYAEERGQPVECTFINQWSIRRGSTRVHYLLPLFRRTIQCS